eukprot:s400_g8.t1
MVSLDLSNAFDKLRYTEMYVSLQETGMPEELSRLLMQVHVQSKLRIIHNGKHGYTTMKRGLRQGCGVAPTIYACWTIRLCRMLNEINGETWVQYHSSIFADDKHYFWEIHNTQDLETAITQLKATISLIHTLGMQINFQKSVAVISVKGRRAYQALRKHTSW